LPRAKKRLPTAKEIDLLRRLNALIGVTDLARRLDLPFYTTRDLVAVERVTERSLRQLRDRLPQLISLLDAPPPRRRKAEPTTEPLQAIDPALRAELRAIAPYVSMVRFAEVLSFSVRTVRAAMAGYRELHASTQAHLRSNLSEVLQPPRSLLRQALVTPSAETLRSLRQGFLAPLPGLTAAETEHFVLANTGDRQPELPLH
jgi:hypothetical protein